MFFQDLSSNFGNFAEDTFIYKWGPTLKEAMHNLEITVENFFEWFSFNNLKSNASKCHLFLFPYSYQPFSVNIRGSNSFNKLKSNASNFHLFFSPYQPVPVNIRGSIIESSNYEKLLGIYT